MRVVFFNLYLYCIATTARGALNFYHHPLLYSYPAQLPAGRTGGGGRQPA